MKPSIFAKVLAAVLFLAVTGYAPQSSFAQRGGHGGGGGSHGGGGGWHGGSGGGGGGSWHGGGGGWHGGGGGWHGGGGSWHGGGGGWHGGSGGGGYYGGWGGGYWGYPGWGFSVGFNWGPFWGGYGYPYGYGWGAPSYPYYYPYSYPYPNYVPAGDPPSYVSSYSSNGPGSNGYAYSSRPNHNVDTNDPSTQPSGAPASYGIPKPDYLSLHEASYTHPVQNPATRAAAPVSYRPTSSAVRSLPPLSPAAQNVIRALRAMPPDARQRQLDSGRYNNLTPQELDIVRYAAELPPS